MSEELGFVFVCVGESGVPSKSVDVDVGAMVEQMKSQMSRLKKSFFFYLGMSLFLFCLVVVKRSLLDGQLIGFE